jgi:predicted RNA-binding Zn-ribbon protein involved in translation (DUF1610 family)
VNINDPRSFLDARPALQTWLKVLLGIWVLSFLGLGWIVQSVLALLALFIIVPAIGFFIFRWWLQKNLVQAPCPVCQFELVGLNGNQTQCPQCGEPLQIRDNVFVRLTPPGTIDVQAVEVTAQVVDD